MEYALTSRGTKMLEAVVIMQGIGIEMMMEDGKKNSCAKGIAGLRGIRHALPHGYKKSV